MNDLPKYNPDARCPKCGHNIVTTEYWQAKDYGKIRDEHFVRICMRCGYGWREACLTATDVVKKVPPTKNPELQEELAIAQRVSDAWEQQSKNWETINRDLTDELRTTLMNMTGRYVGASLKPKEYLTEIARVFREREKILVQTEQNYGEVYGKHEALDKRIVDAYYSLGLSNDKDSVEDYLDAIVLHAAQYYKAWETEKAHVRKLHGDVADLQDALAPFAVLADKIPDAYQDDNIMWGLTRIDLTAGDFRRAKEVLATIVSGAGK